MVKLGIAGFSEGNGHPYSFASIINGFSERAEHWNGWEVIFNYLNRQPKENIGLDGYQVSHVWTQEPDLTRHISRAALIPTVCETLHEMLGEVDGLIIARDDFQTHFEMARAFLEAGLPVFIDKPLSLSIDELRFFKPYLEKGQLMSCSGFRFAQELDDLRADSEFGNIKLARGATINGWEKYGIHMLEGIFGIHDFHVDSVMTSTGLQKNYLLKNKSGQMISIDCLGRVQKTFQFDFWSEGRRFGCEINDNFTAFKRTIEKFTEMMSTKSPVIPSDLTIKLMRILIAGNLSEAQGREVLLSEITV